MHHLVSDIVRTLSSDYTIVLEREMHAAVAAALGAPLSWDEILTRCELLLGPRQWELRLDGRAILRIDLPSNFTPGDFAPVDRTDGTRVLMSRAMRFTPL